MPLFSGKAQVDSLAKSIQYYNAFVSGVLIGSSSSSTEKEFTASLATIHGVKFRSGVKLGLGVGLDAYHDLKIVPVFLSFTIDQEYRRHGLFVQLNMGYSTVRYTGDDMQWWVGSLYDKGGPTINPIIGYRIKVENMRIYWQVGYKYQLAEVGYSYTDWGGMPQLFSRYYELNRFVLQLGFGFR